MTEFERQWLKSLQNCLKEKPDTVEIFVQELVNGTQGCWSEIHLMQKGSINNFQRDAETAKANRLKDYSLADITCAGIAARQFTHD